MTGAGFASALLLAAAPVPLPAGHGDAAAFLAGGRAATAGYRDRGAAVADGYRRIGQDFPGMGEHWIHIGRVFDGRLEAERPEVLTYAVIDGRPVLTGVAWVVPLLDGEAAPDSPVPAAMWHSHEGTLDDETLAPRHDRSGRGAGARLAMLHAWVWLDNPAGPFAADNWALPWHRLGRAPPPGAPASAGRALSLLGPTADYWDAVVGSAAGAHAGVALSLLERARLRSRALLSEDPPDLAARLAHLWSTLCREVGTAAGEAARQRLAGAGAAHPH